MRVGLRSISSSGLRQCVLLTLLFSVCAPMLPLSRSAATKEPGKDLSVPFPCQSRACGCRSAAQCQKKCCCFSRAEKVAWARRQGPHHAVATPAPQPAPRHVDSSELCVAPGLDRPRFHALLPPQTVDRKRHETEGSNRRSPRPTETVTVVIGWVETACHGETVIGLGFKPMLPIDLFCWSPEGVVRAWGRPASSSLNGQAPAPPLPPPRIPALLG
jgi:hypothetical protein